MVTRDTSSYLNDAFLSWLTHELRSPLNACVMWLDVLALAPQPDKLTQAVDVIKRNLARQARLVNDLNDAGKVATGGLAMHAEPLDVVAVLMRSLDAWQVLAVGKQLAFDRSIELERALIDGDPQRLSQALNHVLENAIGSTPPGGRVALRVHGADGKCVIEVEDTGAALSAEDAANLPVPLWRAPTSAKSRSGLGLGLAVAHHIATSHGGSLSAESSASGVRFKMTLPLAARDGETEPVVHRSNTSQS
jgi:signal transduction histidine kinase